MSPSLVAAYFLISVIDAWMSGSTQVLTLKGQKATLFALALLLTGLDSCVIAHADVRSSGPSGKGNPFKVRRMASSAPMAFRRPVSITDLMSA